ncbi:MAG: hypothetical protein ACTSWN_15275 [Promethearchaeota archaeon]
MKRTHVKYQDSIPPNYHSHLESTSNSLLTICTKALPDLHYKSATSYPSILKE